MITEIIGRKSEIQELTESYESRMAEFVIVYGRRRVGKTFLVRHVFENNFDFYVTGLFNKSKERQLENFSNALSEYSGEDCGTPKDWYDAFRKLKQYLKNINRPGRKIVFFDEMPWMDTQKSDFVSALENFWNGWGSGEKDLMLIVCGSATSWITKKLFGDVGGLYNRDTRRICLQPFTLKETEEYLIANNIMFNRYEIAECYMILGGIPFYLSKIRKGFSLAQNIDMLLFRKNCALKDEFKHLYDALFRKSELYVKVVEALSEKKEGLARSEISNITGIPNSGYLTKILSNLIDCNFVAPINLYGKKSRETVYQLSDFFTLFYFRFIKDNFGKDENFWTNRIDSPSHRAWCGFAFEQICMAHINGIKDRLGISGVATVCSAWREKSENGGAQIDLIIDRRDQVTDICEMKFSLGEYSITKEYAESLMNKINVFRDTVKTRNAIHLVMVTSFGLKKNSHSGVVQNEVTLDDLFGS